MTYSFNIEPVAKPRQTQSDKWRLRDCVAKYRAFADTVRLMKVAIPEAGSHIVFHLPMPKSWPKKKRAEMNGQPHRQRPDADNLFKALADAIYREDSHIHDVRISKIWSEKGRIEIRENSSSPGSDISPYS